MVSRRYAARWDGGADALILNKLTELPLTFNDLQRTGKTPLPMGDTLNRRSHGARAAPTLRCRARTTRSSSLTSGSTRGSGGAARNALISSS